MKIMNFKLKINILNDSMNAAKWYVHLGNCFIPLIKKGMKAIRDGKYVVDSMENLLAK